MGLVIARCRSRDDTTGRFAVLRDLGRGGEGTVQLVHDEERGEHVAQKRLHEVQAGRLAALKREFRGLADLRHPGLVRVYELGVDRRGAYFTMEAIDGVDLAAFRERHGAAATLRLLPRLCDALEHLHARGIVHGDLKPSNVMVRESGAPVLLDFGALTRLSDAHHGPRAGTPGYVAPEVLQGAAPSPAADRYALGGLLFFCVAGQPPFRGPIADVLRAQLESPPPRLDGAASELVEACAALLARDPDDRPSLAELRKRSRWEGSVELPSSSHLVGREELLRDLGERAAASRPGAHLLLLSGPSGVGKTALIDALGGRLRAGGLRVLRGRARLEERVPFNLVDGAVDELALALRSRPPHGTLREAVVTAAETFPVLAQVSGHDVERHSVRARVAAGLFGSRPEPRVATFDAVVRLLCERPTVLLLDDFQWADEDALALVGHMLDGACAPLLLVAAARDEMATPALAWLESRDVETVRVPRLGESELSEIITRRAGELAMTLEPARARELAASCDGRPFVAEVIVRGLLHDGASLEDAVDALDAEAQSALGMVIANSHAMGAAALEALLAVPRSELLGTLDTLVAGGMLRRLESDRLDVYHDGVREAASRALVAGTLERAHGRLADDIARRERPDLPRLVNHLLRADRRADAVAHAEPAARHAIRLHAYALAAELFALAVEHPGADRDALERARAGALERCGRFQEAAEVYAALLESASHEARDALSLSHAQALLASNQISEGAAVLDRARHTANVGHVSARDLAAGVRFLIGPLRKPRGDNRGTDTRAAHHVALGVMLSFFNPLAGVRFMLRARDGFERAGAQLAAARCELVLSHYAQYGRPGRGLVPLSARYRRAAEQRMEAHGLDDPVLRTTIAFIEGFDALRLVRWDEAAAHFERATAAAEAGHLHGTFEHLLLRSYSCLVPYYAQRPLAYAALVGRFRAAAAGCGDTALRTHLAIAEMGEHLITGRIARARAAIDASFAALPRGRHTIQRDVIARMWCWVGLYDRDPAELLALARATTREEWRYGLRNCAQASMFAGIFALVEAAALRAGVSGASHRKLRREAKAALAGPPLCSGLALRALAYGADARGRPEEAIARLEEAERHADSLGQILDRGIARHQRGLRLGGDEGRALCASAEADVTRLGAQRSLLDEDRASRR